MSFLLLNNNKSRNVIQLILMLISLPSLSTLTVIFHHSQMFTRTHSSSISLSLLLLSSSSSLLLTVNLVELFPMYDFSVCMSCLFQFDQTLFFFTSFDNRALSLLLIFFLRFRLVMLPRVFLLLSLACSRIVIIVIRKIVEVR